MPKVPNQKTITIKKEKCDTVNLYAKINIEALKDFVSFAKNIGSEALTIKEDKIVAGTKENSLEKEYASNYSISFVINNISLILSLIDSEECNVNFISNVKPMIFFNGDEKYVAVPIKVGEQDELRIIKKP